MSADNQFAPIMIVVVLALAVFAIWAEFRNYAECRAVPHTAFYCLTSGG